MNQFPRYRNISFCWSFVTVSALALSASFFGCSGDSDTGIRGSSSSCGGFGAGNESVAAALMIQSDAVLSEVEQGCDEALNWTGDPATGSVTFVHTNNRLNCCGVRSIEAIPMKDGAGFELAETDRSESGARCNCVCLYDFEVEVPVDQSAMHVKLTLWVEEEESNPGRQVVWEGEIDLSAGFGSVLIRERNGDCW